MAVSNRGKTCSFRRLLMSPVLVLFSLVSSATVAIASMPETAPPSPILLSELSIEELMNVRVSSVSRKMEKLSEAAAAIFVITQEDIRRSGVTSVPEALRMVPGVQVARIDANKWAISARGFNSRLANKLLVLIDGRSVYTPLFSGVFWDVQDLMLEDVERIEVIRGPGSTLWGANAVNGVINIITKTAGDTQGGLVTAGAGTSERGFGAVRYGGKLGHDAYYRIYTKYFDRDGFRDSSGKRTADDWRVARSGFRMDAGHSGDDAFTLQGDMYGGKAGQTGIAPSWTPPFATRTDMDADIKGGNILGRWTHIFSGSSQMSLQMYYDRTNRSELVAREIRDTADFDLQHWFQASENHRIIWGVGYRYTHDRIASTFTLTLDPERRGEDVISAFVQDDITIVPDHLRLILGSKFEHNDYTGFEIQPNARLLWLPDRRQTVWAAVSRAVKTPSRAEDNATGRQVTPPNALFPGSPLTVLALSGNTNLRSEKVVAYEIGYRNQLHERLSVDLAAFYNSYRDIGIYVQGTPGLELSPLPHLVIPATLHNILKGRSYGAEAAVEWQAADFWRLHLAYTLFRMSIDREGISGTVNSNPDKNPNYQVSLRSNMDLGRGVEFDLWFRHVDELLMDDVKDYSTLDARIGWKPVRNLELSVVGQNLLKKRHKEFPDETPAVIPTETPRSVYAKVTWRF